MIHDLEYCNLCLEANNDLINLHTSNEIQLLQECLQFFLPNIVFPDKVTVCLCQKCHKKFEIFQKFGEMCKKNGPVVEKLFQLNEESTAKEVTASVKGPTSDLIEPSDTCVKIQDNEDLNGDESTITIKEVVEDVKEETESAHVAGKIGETEQLPEISTGNGPGIMKDNTDCSEDEDVDILSVETDLVTFARDFVTTTLLLDPSAEQEATITKTIFNPTRCSQRITTKKDYSEKSARTYHVRSEHKRKNKTKTKHSKKQLGNIPLKLTRNEMTLRGNYQHDQQMSLATQELTKTSNIDADLSRQKKCRKRSHSNNTIGKLDERYNKSDQNNKHMSLRSKELTNTNNTDSYRQKKRKKQSHSLRERDNVSDEGKQQMSLASTELTNTNNHLDTDQCRQKEHKKRSHSDSVIETTHDYYIESDPGSLQMSLKSKELINTNNHTDPNRQKKRKKRSHSLRERENVSDASKPQMSLASTELTNTNNHLHTDQYRRKKGKKRSHSDKVIETTHDYYIESDPGSLQMSLKSKELINTNNHTDPNRQKKRKKRSHSLRERENVSDESYIESDRLEMPLRSKELINTNNHTDQSRQKKRKKRSRSVNVIDKVRERSPKSDYINQQMSLACKELTTTSNHMDTDQYRQKKHKKRSDNATEILPDSCHGNQQLLLACKELSRRNNHVGSDQRKQKKHEKGSKSLKATASQHVFNASCQEMSVAFEQLTNNNNILTDHCDESCFNMQEESKNRSDQQPQQIPLKNEELTNINDHCMADKNRYMQLYIRNHKDRKRRSDVRNKIEELRTLVPEVSGKVDATLLVILRETINYCMKLQQISASRIEEMKELYKTQSELRSVTKTMFVGRKS